MRQVYGIMLINSMIILVIGMEIEGYSVTSSKRVARESFIDSIHCSK